MTPQQTIYRQSIIIALILLVLMALGVATGELSKRTNSSANGALTTQTAKTIQYKGEDGKSVLELLKRDHSVEVVDSSFGVYIKSIGDVTSRENQAWLFYVDNALGNDAADKVITTNNQTIEWRYETY